MTVSRSAYLIQEHQRMILINWTTPACTPCLLFENAGMLFEMFGQTSGRYVLIVYEVSDSLFVCVHVGVQHRIRISKGCCCMVFPSCASKKTNVRVRHDAKPGNHKKENVNLWKVNVLIYYWNIDNKDRTELMAFSVFFKCREKWTPCPPRPSTRVD